MGTRAIDFPTALLVAIAALCCSVVVGCAFVLLVGGDVPPGSRDAAAWWAAAGLACASVAALIALTRSAGGLRPGALAAAWLLAFAWPLSGFPLAAAVLATAGTAVAVAYGASGRAGARAAALLAVAALELVTVAVAAAPGDGAAYHPPAAARAAAGGPSSPAPDAGSSPAPDAGTSPAPDAGSSPAPDAGTSPAPDAGSPPAPRCGSSSPATGAPRPRRASPARAVRAYYRALDRRDFSRAWRSLSPAVRAGFGGFARWRAGFGATLSSAPGELRVAVTGDDAAVDHVLTAHDRAACGVLVQRFDVRWRLRRTADAWQAVALSAGQRPGARCLTS